MKFFLLISSLLLFVFSFAQNDKSIIDGVVAVVGNEVVFLSANSWDISGGGNYGYNSIWVNRNNNTFDNLDYFPKHQIKDLSKLLDII